MKNIFRNDLNGNVAIEFAIILPLLIIIIFAVIEFGAYFVKDQITLNAVASISSSLEQTPDDANIEQDAKDYGGIFLSFDKDPNYFCAQAYETRNEAKNGSCTDGWNTSKPSGMDENEPYYIRLEAKAEKLKIFFSDYLPNIHRDYIVTIGAKVVIPTVQKVQVICPTGASSNCTANCPANTQVVGGGVQWLATNGTCHVSTSYPLGNGWTGGTSRVNDTTTYCAAAVHALCL